MKFQIRGFFPLLVTALLGACGGGGGSGSSVATTPGQAQGYYAGNFASSTFPSGRFSTLVLDSDEIWTLYGTEGTAGQLLVYGLIEGQGASSGGSFSASALRDYYYDGTSNTGTLSATYQIGSSFNGTVSSNGRSVSFVGVVPAAGSTGYNYNTQAQLSDISGAWSGTEMSGTTFNITVGNAGALAGTTPQGCTLTGQLQPRAGGKNVFDMTFTMGSVAACGSGAGTSGRGIAVTSLLTNNRRQLIIAGVTNDRRMGTAMFATR